MGRFIAQPCLICGGLNFSAGMGGVTRDGKVLCGLCYTSADFDEKFNIKNYTAAALVDYYKENDLYFKATREFLTHLVFGIKHTVVQFDDERKLWRMIPYGEDGFRKEAWLYRYSDIANFELIKFGKYASTCDCLKIRVIVNEENGSSVLLTFIDAPYETKKDSSQYKKISASANGCMSVLKEIISSPSSR